MPIPVCPLPLVSSGEGYALRPHFFSCFISCSHVSLPDQTPLIKDLLVAADLQDVAPVQAVVVKIKTTATISLPP